MATLSNRNHGQKIVFNPTGEGGATLNINFAWIDALQGGVKDRIGTTPSSPSEGDLYILTGTLSGDWDFDRAAVNDLALYYNSNWVYLTPPAGEGGLRLWVQAENNVYTWNGSSWIITTGGGITEIVQDTTPELGGQLDALNNKIVNLGEPTESTDAANKEYVDNTIGVVINYYFNDTASDIGGIYYEMRDSDLGEATSTIVQSGIGTGDDQAFVNFATPTGGAGLTKLREGTYVVHTHFERTSGNKDIAVYAEIYTRTSGGTETLRMTSAPSDLIVAQGEYDLTANLATEVAIDPTDRLVVKFYINAASGGSTSEITFYLEDDFDSSLVVPTTFQTFSNTFLRLDGGNQMQGDISLGSYQINDMTIGTMQIAEGTSVAGSGLLGSFAQGTASTASGSAGSFAQGSVVTNIGSRGTFAQGLTVTNTGITGAFSQGEIVTGLGSVGSFAQGYTVTASGSNGVFVQGNSSEGNGFNGMFVQGLNSTSLANSAATFAQGFNATVLKGYGSFAQGGNVLADGTNGSFAQGYTTSAMGSAGSFAQGVNATAAGYNGSFAQGNSATASRDEGSFAQGNSAQARGSAGSFAQGKSTTAIGIRGSFAQGDIAHARGGFGSFSQGSNATSFNTGSFAQGVNVTSMYGYGSFVQGKDSYATAGQGAFVQGKNSTSRGAAGSFAQGYYASAFGNYGSFAQGGSLYDDGYNITTYPAKALGNYGSFAQGADATASGDAGSFAQGQNATASGSNGCFAMGFAVVASANGSFAHGNSSSATAAGAVQFGAGTNSRANSLQIQSAPALVAGIGVNFPVLSADPGSPVDGDVWIYSNGGTREIRVRISGVTYSVAVS